MVILNGGFMKQLSGNKQKWVLSLALLAVLGTQSYHSVDSKMVHSFELSSTAPTADIKTAADIKAEKDAVARKAAEKSDSASTDPNLNVNEKLQKELKEMQSELKDIKAALKQSSKVEGKATDSCPTGDCGKTEEQKKSDEIATLKKRIEELTKGKDKNKDEDNECDEDNVENLSAKERRACIAKAKKERKEQIAKEKKEKEQEAKEEANDSFKEKVSEIAEECVGDGPSCSAEKFTHLLSDFSGKNKVKPESKEVIKAFNSLVGNKLRSAAANPDSSEEVAKTLLILGSDLPSEYNNISFKKNALEMVSAGANLQAQAINNKFVMAQALSKRNDMQSTMQVTTLMSEGLQQRQQLQMNLQQETSSMVDGLQSAGDTNTLAYMSSVYLPNVNKLITSLLDTSGNSLNSLNGTTTAQTTSTSGRGVVRGGNNASQILVNGNNQIPNSGGSSSGNLLNGVNFGALNNTRTINRTGTAQ